MRILLINPFRDTSVGGVTSAVAALAREFTRLGHSVVVLSRGSSNTPVYVNDTHFDGTAYSNYAVELRALGLDQGTIRNVRHFASCLAWLPYVLLSLVVFLRKAQPDVVVLHYPCPRQFYWGLLRRVCNWKLVATFQGGDAHKLTRYSRLNRFAMRLLVRPADALIAVSESLAQKVCAEFSIAGGSILVIPNGASDCEVMPPPEVSMEFPDQFIMTAGKLIPRKGVDVVIKAISLLRTKGTEIRTLVFGSGAEENNLKTLAKAEGVSDILTFAGDQPQVILFDAMKRCRVFVLASRAEGLPLVVAEAMANGAPVVATNVDGTPQIVMDGVNGLLVEPDDVESLAKSIERAWFDTELTSRLSEAGRQTVQKRFSWKSIALRYIDCIERCGNVEGCGAVSFVPASGE